MEHSTDFLKLMFAIAQNEWGEEIYRTAGDGRRVLVWKEPDSHEEYEFNANGKLLKKVIKTS
ncbi:MAG: hypothetical protein IJ150_09710 [Bacteroidales bacterium]|nr:hypothetical protein [Bacteroidales bacterium]